MVISTDSEQFAHDVLESKTPVLVDFWATWCGPCRAMAPILERFSQAHEGTIKVMKVDVDENPRLANQYAIMSIPTMVLFENGQEIKRHVGTAPLVELHDLFVGAHLHSH